MMVMPGNKLTHLHAPPPALFLGGGTWAAIYCVYKGPRSTQKGRTKKNKREKLSHTRDQTKAVAYPIAELTSNPPGGCAIGSQETEHIARTYNANHHPYMLHT